jgi:predicted HTH domain antitoxin
MPQTAVLEMRLPADVVAAIRSYGRQGATDEERLRLPLAIGLFAEGAISLAKAARMAGLTRYEFAKLLKRRGLAAYEYTEADYRDDLAFMRSTVHA